MMSPRSASMLAQWLAQNEPAIFAELEKNAAIEHSRLNGWSDILSSVGNAVSSGVSAVGDFLTSEKGIASLTGLTTAYLAGKQQSNVLATQLALAQAGQPPAPIQNTIGANNQIVPVYTPTNQVATNQLLYSLQPSFLQTYKVPLLIGATGLALLIVLRR